MGRQKVTSQEIDGYRYAVVQLPATTGRKISVELAKALAPALTAMVKDAKLGQVSVSSLLDKELSAGDIGDAVEVLFDRLPPRRIDELMTLFAEHSDVFGDGFGDGGAPLAKNFDEHFAGRYAAMYQWLWFALRVNFADFFGDHGGEVAQ
jgi:hypothetical protein